MRTGRAKFNRSPNNFTLQRLANPLIKAFTLRRGSTYHTGMKFSRDTHIEAPGKGFERIYRSNKPIQT